MTFEDLSPNTSLLNALGDMGRNLRYIDLQRIGHLISTTNLYAQKKGSRFSKYVAWVSLSSSFPCGATAPLYRLL